MFEWDPECKTCIEDNTLNRGKKKSEHWKEHQSSQKVVAAKMEKNLQAGDRRKPTKKKKHTDGLPKTTTVPQGMGEMEDCRKPLGNNTVEAPLVEKVRKRKRKEVVELVVRKPLLKSSEGALRCVKVDKRTKTNSINSVEVCKEKKKSQKAKHHERESDRKLVGSPRSVLKESPASQGNTTQPSLNCNEIGSDVGNNVRKQLLTGNAEAVLSEPVGMEIYWKLASVNASVRELASLALVRELEISQEAYESDGHRDRLSEEVAEDEVLGAVKDDDGLRGCSPGVRYAIRRLVRGVSSSHESARQGFAMALASVIGALPCIKSEVILKLIKNFLEVTPSMKGQEARDGLLGQLFAYGAVVRASRLIGDSMEQKEIRLAGDVVEQLLVLAQKKSFLREPATAVLLHFLDTLSLSTLQDSIMVGPLFKQVLLTLPENGNADTLHLLLRLIGKIPAYLWKSCKLLPASGNAQDLFLPSHLKSIVPCLKDSSSSHPRVHPVWVDLIELMFADSTSLSSPEHITKIQSTANERKNQESLEDDARKKHLNFEKHLASLWDVVVESALLNSSHERKHLAMKILLLLLPRLPVCSVYIVLSNSFVRCLLDILSVKDSFLYKSAHQFLEDLCSWAMEDEQYLVAVVISLQHGSHGNFDSISRTETVKRLLVHLKSRDGCLLLLCNLTKLFVGWKKAELRHQLVEHFNSDDPYETENIAEEDDGDDCQKKNEHVGKLHDNQRLWVLDQMCTFYKQVQVEQVIKVFLQKEVLKLVCLNALFVASPSTKLTVQDSGEVIRLPEIPISDSVRKICLARLQSLLVNAQPLLGTHRLKLTAACAEDLLSFFLHYYDLLEKCPLATHVHPLSNDDKEIIDLLRSVALQLSFAIEKAQGEEKGRIQAMRVLLIQLLVQSLSSKVSDLAMEIVICCKKVFGNLLELVVEDNDDDYSPASMDVLMEILLSLLAQSSAPIRAAAEQVFKSFCDDLTESSLMSMLQVIKKQISVSRHTTMVAINDEDIEEDECLSLEECEVMDVRDDELKETSDVLETKQVISDESESDLDDEAMFRVDAHLAHILTQKKMVAAKGGNAKDVQTQLLHFKFRVLSLVEFFVQKKANSSLVLTALPFLLQAFVVSCSADGHELLADRIGLILKKKLFKAKEYPKGLDLYRTQVDELLTKALKLASRSKLKKVQAMAQDCSLWLLKVLYRGCQYDSNIDNKVLEVFEDALEDFFVQKRNTLNSSFFREAFMRYPWLGRATLKTLLRKCMDARSEYLRYEALSLVGSILHLKVNNEMPHQDQRVDNMTELVGSLLPILGEVLLFLLQKPASKAIRRSAARRFCSFTLKFLSQLYPDRPLKDLIGDVAYSEYLRQLSQPTGENAQTLVADVPVGQ
eukprot:c28830_g1_i1 orf=479-4615(-)